MTGPTQFRGDRGCPCSRAEAFLFFYVTGRGQPLGERQPKQANKQDAASLLGKEGVGEALLSCAQQFSDGRLGGHSFLACMQFLCTSSIEV